ncbi:uncharacterized protein LOC144881813 [Branchiostoma floridae x Branchiostoma japonicum]
MEERFCALLLLSLAAVGTSGIHTETVQLVEGDETTIECPRPLVQRLNITSARYGTETCESAGALQTLQAVCGGESSCTVRAGDGVFGDSCQGEARLEFTYECWNFPGYYGCFGDGYDRALSGPVWRPSGLTVQACLKRCRNSRYKYAGVEYAYECFCGNDENFGKHGEKPLSDCNDPCSGDNGQYCGGGWRIEVYESSMGRPCAAQTLNGSRHYVYSPDFPGLYPDSKSCEWTIQAQDDKVVKLQFDLLNLPSGNLTVRDGTEDSQDLATLSGLTMLTGATIPDVPASSGSAIWVQFQSGGGRGRFIFWSQEIDHCGAIPLPPGSGTAAAPYVGHVGVGETAMVICNTGELVWVTCGEDRQFNDTGPYCQDETTAVSSTVSYTQTPHHDFPTKEGSSTPQDSRNPPTQAAQTGEGTGSTVTFIAVGVAVPLVVIATVAMAVVVCRRKRNAASNSPGSTHEFTSSRASAPPSRSVGLTSLEARYVTNGGTGDPSDEHLYAVPDDGRARKAAKPRRGDQTRNRSPAPPVNQNHDEGFTENDLYESADDVTTRPGRTESEAEGSVENIIYGEID